MRQQKFNEQESAKGKRGEHPLTPHRQYMRSNFGYGRRTGANYNNLSTRGRNGGGLLTFDCSGKGRFGKRALSISIDQSGFSNDSNNSNDSGVDFNSYESHPSWCSEDAQLGRSSSISNLSTISGIHPQFPNSGKQELCQELVKEENKIDHSTGSLSSEGPVGNLLDISTARLLLPEKAQLASPPLSMRISPDSAEQVANMVVQVPLMEPGNHSPNSTVSPVPMKRARFSYSPQSGGKGTTGLKLRNQGVRGSIGKRLPPGTSPTLSSNLSPVSRDGRVQLQIVAQPEEQHRARYQTEGSRGAIKDRKGNGFPTVKLVGYDKAATLQIFIGTDQGKISPHMFYQACKVTGKSSTPCIEKKVEGTVVIEIEFEPSKDMVISCDCVGILKERNVDVEQRFPFHHAAQSRKKSTKCRMVYRTTIINSQGMEETLQLTSSPILCTQPPGHPEICKQSLQEGYAKGGQEIFIIGKNFLKDTKVYFQEEDSDERMIWEVMVEPLKDFLQQNHLICVAPPYKNQAIVSPTECKITIVSGGKQSEPQRFCYLPNISSVSYGISSPSSAASVASPTSSVLSQDVLAAPNVSHNQVQMPLNMHTTNASLVVNNEDSNMSQHTVHIGGPVTSPTRTTAAPVTFPQNISTIASVQERQVVNELQSILDRSVQQQNQQRAPEPSVSEMMTMSIKNEQPAFSNIHPTPITATVPLDLQFPNAVVPVSSTVETSTDVSQSSIGFNEPITSSQFAPVVTAPQGASCIQSTVSLLQRQGSIEMANVERRMLTELMPNTRVSIPSSEALVAVTSGISANSVTGTLTVPITTVPSSMCQVGEMIKVEQQGSSIRNPMNAVPISNATQSEPNTATTMPSQNFVTGELQAHQGPIANAITEMSDNELINYINPSCFEQDVPLV